MAGGIADIGVQHRRIGKEDGVQLCCLGLAGNILIELYVGDAVGLRVRMPPGRLMMSARIDERIENQLFGFSAHGNNLFFALRTER
ncbi:hypothetical protein D3C72_2067620 [compost metagenome]